MFILMALIALVWLSVYAFVLQYGYDSRYLVVFVLCVFGFPIMTFAILAQVFQ